MNIIGTFADLQNLMQKFQLFSSLAYVVLPFTDLRNSSYQKMFSLHEVAVSHKLVKKRRNKDYSL